MPKKRIIILGAGLAGLSAAWRLQQEGKEVLLLEKEPEVGGLCRSKKVAGFTFDYDGHLLHFRQRSTLNLIQGLVRGNLIRHSKSSWIYSCGRYTPYPFQANLYGLPAPIVKECLAGFIEASGNGCIKKASNFLEWINKKFGTGIARHFMVPYNTKFWTIPPHQMNCYWLDLDGFIPLPSLKRVILGAVEENREPLGYNAFFWYPKQGGIGQLPQAFSRRIKNIYTNCAISEINLKKKEIRSSCGMREKYDFLISTLPLPEIPNLIRGLPQGVASNFKKLKWNSIFNLNLGIDKPLGYARHWVYFPEKDPVFFRAGFYSNFSPGLAPPGKSSLYIEVAYSENKPIDKRNIASRIEEGLKKTGILSSGAQILCRDINDIKYGYPLYDKNYSPARQRIIKYLMRNDILACGRYGCWRYFSMEDAMLDGNRAAQLLC